MRVLPVSQSEGPTKFSDVLDVSGDGSWPYGIWLILKDHLRIPQSICVQKQKRARLGSPRELLDEISPLGLFFPPSVPTGNLELKSSCCLSTLGGPAHLGTARLPCAGFSAI